MNVEYYQFGNPIKARYRKHYCYKCGTSLLTIKHEKIVYQDSEEARNYSFSDFDGQMVGSCKFIHNVFYCPKCSDNIEFITQVAFTNSMNGLTGAIQRQMNCMFATAMIFYGVSTITFSGIDVLFDANEYWFF